MQEQLYVSFLLNCFNSKKTPSNQKIYVIGDFEYVCVYRPLGTHIFKGNHKEHQHCPSVLTPSSSNANERQLNKQASSCSNPSAETLEICKICSKLTIKTTQSIFIVNFIYITPFSTASIVKFELIQVCWESFKKYYDTDYNDRLSKFIIHY